MGGMTGANLRRHERVKHQVKIQVHSDAVVHTLQMQDFSESGLYLICPNTSIISIMDVVKVQTLEFEDAPLLDAKVVRVEENIGFAVEFIQ
ncbi:MAG: small ligand-binding sensory domain FIST [Methylophagaceae bacterium]|jgi:small ligand-binding sensory domain FIST